MKERARSTPLDQGFWSRFLLRQRSALRRYLFALIASLLSLLSVALLESYEQTRVTSFALFSVILSAIYGGLGPAILDTLITTIGVDYLFAEPVGRIFTSWASVFRIVNYLVVGLLVSSIVSSLRRSYLDLADSLREVELAKKARENVVAVVSHDLRGPISTILMYASLIEGSVASGKPLADFARPIGGIRRSAERMNRLVEDLLDAVRIEMGRFQISPEQNDIDSIVADAIESTMTTAASKRIRIRFEPEAKGLRAFCDRQRIIQTLDNLLGNAIKFSPEESTVTVRASSDGHWIRFEVADQGQGIPKENLSSVFTRYGRDGEAASQGTGLGLFICRSIVEVHGGEIGVRSAPGRGSTFYFTLPGTRSVYKDAKAA